MPVEKVVPANNKKAPYGAFLYTMYSGPQGCASASSVCLAGSRYADRFALQRASGLEYHLAVCGCKQGVVTAHADIVTGMELGTALTDQDVACNDRLATEFLHAESFRL